MKIRTVSSSVAYLEQTDALLNCNCAANAISISLNPSAQYQGAFTIKKSEGSTNAVTITPATGETIDGASSVSLTFLNDKKTLVPVFGGWTVIDSTLSIYHLTLQMVDAGTAQSRFAVAPQAGNIIGAYAVNSVANATTKTVLSLKIATVAVTMPAWEIAVTQAAGVVSSSVPTAANVVTVGQAIEVISDGGTDATMPTTITLVIAR